MERKTIWSRANSLLMESMGTTICVPADCASVRMTAGSLRVFSVTPNPPTTMGNPPPFGDLSVIRIGVGQTSTFLFSIASEPVPTIGKTTYRTVVSFLIPTVRLER